MSAVWSRLKVLAGLEGAAKKILSLQSVPNVYASTLGSHHAVWKLGKFNHVAIAVPDLEKATAFYRDVLNAAVSAPQKLPEHGVTTVFIELDNTKLELLHPLGDNSPIEKFLQKNKSGGLHHICIEVDDILSAIKDVRAAGIRCLGKEPKIGAHGKPVMFLHPADCNGVLLELEES